MHLGPRPAAKAGLSNLDRVNLREKHDHPYLEALDRDMRKPHENPAIGVLLCASRDAEVAEYALTLELSRTDQAGLPKR